MTFRKYPFGIPITNLDVPKGLEINNVFFLTFL